MRRLLLLGCLLLPLPAAAQSGDAFCAGLQRAIQLAANGFLEVPLNEHLIPGTIEQRRGVLEDQDGPARAALIVVVYADPTRRETAALESHFHGYAERVARCLPGAASNGPLPVARGVMSSWQTEQARIRLRRDAGDLYSDPAKVEITVASRW
ncbi:hypothetical protein [Falsiroseomonas sp. HW251]|uniref:hypothetical protein n=1 Tax=Falsiroseomonas sp. HW251 TaxID=3390998 RepID=UPI003D3221BA